MTLILYITYDEIMCSIENFVITCTQKFSVRKETFRNSRTFELTEALHYLKTLIDVFFTNIFVSSKVGFIKVTKFLHGFSCVYGKRKKKVSEQCSCHELYGHYHVCPAIKRLRSGHMSHTSERKIKYYQTQRKESVRYCLASLPPPYKIYVTMITSTHYGKFSKTFTKSKY